MFSFLTASRHNDRPSARRQRSSRSPLIEDLEGRKLLSGIQGNHIGMSAAGIVGRHIDISITKTVDGSGLPNGADTVRFFEYDWHGSYDTLGPRNVSHE